MSTQPLITFLTGAGISTGAGIPDFRGPQGVWTRDPEAEKTSTLSWYLRDPEIRKRAWQLRAASAVWDVEPTPAHRAIAELEGSGQISGIITQNIDGLHQAAGSSPALVHEVHGNVRRWRCEYCRATGPMAEMIDRVRAGEEDPPCPMCGGIIRATPLLQSLHQRGCKIALDDFGTGMQSFDRLQQLPIDLVKIDGAFVRNILSNARDRELVRAMVTIANAYQAETVAEYVENEQLLRMLQELGVEWGQGHYIARPVPLVPTPLTPAESLHEKQVAPSHW